MKGLIQIEHFTVTQFNSELWLIYDNKSNTTLFDIRIKDGFVIIGSYCNNKIQHKIPTYLVFECENINNDIISNSIHRIACREYNNEYYLSVDIGNSNFMILVDNIIVSNIVQYYINEYDKKNMKDIKIVEIPEFLRLSNDKNKFDHLNIVDKNTGILLFYVTLSNNIVDFSNIKRHVSLKMIDKTLLFLEYNIAIMSKNNKYYIVIQLSTRHTVTLPLDINIHWHKKLIDFYNL